MEKQIIDILRKYTEIPPEKINSESRLAEDLGLNSLDLMNVIIAFEDYFDIEIPENDIQGLYRISDIVEYLKRKL